MKKYMCIILFALTLFGVLSGCQKTPDSPIIIGKDIDQVIEKAQSTPTTENGQNESLATKLGIPDALPLSLQDAPGHLTVNVNATFVLPNADILPTARVSMDTFSQETANKIMNVLLQGATLYDMSTWQETKADIQERLVELYAMRDGTIPVDVDSGNLEEDIKLYEQRLAEAPDTIELIPASSSFVTVDEPPLEPYQRIEGTTEINNKSAYLRIMNQTETNMIEAVFINRDEIGAMTEYRSWSEVPDKERKLIDDSFVKPTINADQAKQTADQIIQGLGLSDMQNSIVEQAVDMQTKRYAYMVSYSRLVSNVPITLTADSGSRPEAESGEAGYVAGWRYERIDIVIDDSGVVEFSWISPYIAPEIVTEDSNLLPFSEIQQVFEKMILVKNSWNDSGTTLELNISTVQLGLMRITDPNRRNSGILIPVWDFIGTRTYKNNDEQWSDPSECLLTVNAIDGSIIDRGLGY